MSIRQRRPFTVEIKGKRRKPNWASASLEIPQVIQYGPLASAEPSKGRGGRAAAQAAADILFRRSSTSEQASQSPTLIEVSDAPAVVQAEAAVQPRVLPDLTSQADPIEVRLRQEAEERAARRQLPRGPRRKVEPDAPLVASEIEHETSVAQEIVQKVAPRLRGRKPGITLKAKAPRPVVGQPAPTPSLSAPAGPMRHGEDGGSRSAARAALRRARRKGLPVPLRPGDRWKRRLPKSAR